MRQFSSYGLINKKNHYFVDRKPLITKIIKILSLDNPESSNILTVCAPRQYGKTWIMNAVVERLMKNNHLHIVMLNLKHLKMHNNINLVVQSIAAEIIRLLKLKLKNINRPENLTELFKNEILGKPLCLILDDFDALTDEVTDALIDIFKKMHHVRLEKQEDGGHKQFLLHSLILVGTKSFYGHPNYSEPPFNFQRNFRIPSLTFAEVESIFKWFERETSCAVRQEVIVQIYNETLGHPGFVSWLGELLTEGYNGYLPNYNNPIGNDDFEKVYGDALDVLPNTNILHIISNFDRPPYKEIVLELFNTTNSRPFLIDDQDLNFLYINGIIDYERYRHRHQIKFSCPFVQKRLFNYFSNDFFSHINRVTQPFEDLTKIINNKGLNIKKLLRHYESYLNKNYENIMQNIPRRQDLRIFEVIFHFHLFEYLNHFLAGREASIRPEFTTGRKFNLKIDYNEKLYALEIRSFTDENMFRIALQEAAAYAGRLNLDIIYLVYFVEYITDENRWQYETFHTDQLTGINVMPLLVETGALY